MRTGGALVFSPFVQGSSVEDWQARIPATDETRFLRTHADLLPDRRYYPVLLSLRAGQAFWPVAESKRRNQEQQLAERVGRAAETEAFATKPGQNRLGIFAFTIAPHTDSRRMSHMKAVILAGGLGTRLSEETQIRPKPMVEIGGRPILWHIMKIYSAHGINDFVICLGYKGYMIKEYFANYFLHMSDVTFDMREQPDGGPSATTSSPGGSRWSTPASRRMTGGRLKRVAPLSSGDEPFCFTYGDGVADVDIRALLELPPGRTAGWPRSPPCSRPGRFGALDLEGNLVTEFIEKPAGRRRLDQRRVLRALARGASTTSRATTPSGSASRSSGWPSEGQLAAYQHDGFWQPMDTLRDKNYLEELWTTGTAPWKVWQ